MSNTNESHDFAIAYLIHRSVCDNPETVEEFFADYERAVNEFNQEMAQRNH